MKLIKIKISIITIFLVFLSSCKENNKTNEETDVVKSTKSKEILELPYFNSSDFTPEWGNPVHKIPDFSFINQKGKVVTNDTYNGKIYVADFFFTSCPGICPKLTKSMISIQETYKNDPEIMMLSHSVMPWFDTVKVLNDYAKRNGVLSSKWNLVTGDQKELYAIARNGYFADEDFIKTKEESDFIHTENFVLVDKKGYIRGVYNGTIEIDVKRLKRHIEILRKET
ncbi:SCO family protein [Aquimarina pacifica]|uniref:SCO family protein n=1 Tax=Aquimarina pacifica TaxID=1296415 RepID=UPI0004AF4DEE|nr:SCO family protein [Aquimarina pacifica]